jgi:hypothetical protein
MGSVIQKGEDPMKKLILITALLALLGSLAPGQGSKFRNAVFLHHSVGGVFWDRTRTSNLTPPTTVPKEIAVYNTQHGLTGQNAVSMAELYSPNPASLNDNNWYRWDKIFNGGDASVSLASILTAPVVVVKTCYISQQMMSSVDSINAYKAHIRSIVKVMAAHPERFFVLWTNYPAATDGTSSRAAWSAQFSVWMKDVLATGKDSYGAFPRNVYVFDVFRKLANPVTGLCPSNYGSGSEGPGGDHPSNDAVAVITPAFVTETFNAAIAYELTAGVAPINNMGPGEFKLEQNYPNPFNPTTAITYSIPAAGKVSLTVMDLLGREVATVVDREQSAGTYRAEFNAGALSSGIYFYALRTGSSISVRKMTLVR